MPVRISDERRPIVLDMYLNQEKSAIIIERETGFSLSAIYRILKGEGISPAALRDSGQRRGRVGGYRRFTPDVEQQIVAEYREGSGYHSLAEKYDICVPTVRAILERHGQKARNRGGQRKGVDDTTAQAMLQDWLAGMSQTAIGHKHGMGQTRISNILARFGQQPEKRHVRGNRHGSWKSGRVMQGKYSYVLMPHGHPFYAQMALSSGYVSEHRLVMAEALGRPLEDHETVHHIDGNRFNNTIENLQLRQGRHGTGVIYHCADCGSFNVIAQEIANSEEVHMPDGPPVAQEDRQDTVQPQNKIEPVFSVPQLTLKFQMEEAL